LNELVITAESCRQLDQTDDLSSLRNRFDLPPGVIYLDGNSLGPPPLSIKSRVGELLDQWGSSLIASWFDHDWVNLPAKVGASLEGIIGAEPGTVIACDSTTINLFKAAEAACQLRPGHLLTDSGNFPTDLYVLAEVARRNERELRVVEPEALASAIDRESGVVAITQVDFKTGRLHDLASITAGAHEAGGLMVCDLSHSAGVMRIDVSELGLDLAVGCGYKYLNGGPGAPGYVYVSTGLRESVNNPIAGWFGHEDPFRFEPTYRPAAGTGLMQSGTPHVLSLVALDEALGVFADVDLDAIRAKSVGLTSVFIDLVDQVLGRATEVITPRAADERGSQVTLRHPQASRLVGELAGRGVIVDHRPPDLIRIGFAPLFNTYADAWGAVAALSILI
jgi:kynureninase